ncbi:MAG: DUF1579 domain-containing protein [Acidobacteria bacterium]|nr:DUF1579 domain-containing protein [Acidobacteriota bacterium]
MKHVLAVMILATSAHAAQSTVVPSGDMDAVWGPATAVNQGHGMTDEIRRALAPGAEHDVVARLLGTWSVRGVAGRNSNPISQVASVTAMLDDAWFELRLTENGELSRVAHLGYDGYRASFAMWEVGRGFTSPQARVGDYDSATQILHFRRTYTIRSRDELVRVNERISIHFVSEDEIRWQSWETVGDRPERNQRDVTFTRSRP